MPPISIESVDIKALLKLVETLSTDVSTLKKCVHTQQKTISEMHDAMAAQRAQNDQIMTYASATASVPDSRRAAPSDTGNPPTGNRQNNAAPSGTGNAPIANDNQNGNGSVITNSGSKVENPPRSRRRNIIAGNKKPTGNAGKISGVQRDQRSHIFVTRLSPDCEEDDIVAYIDANLHLTATVEKITGTAHDEVFSSFHVSCQCEPSILMNADLWPEHCLVRRWWLRSRRGHNDRNG